MGTCAKCLVIKIRGSAPNAQNGAVTVQIIENPPMPTMFTHPDLDMCELDAKFREWTTNVTLCDICDERISTFKVSYHSKKK